MKYKNKQTGEIAEAIRFRGFDDVEDLCEFMKPLEPEFFSTPDYAMIPTPVGPMRIGLGDWVFKRGEGSFIGWSDATMMDSWSMYVDEPRIVLSSPGQNMPGDTSDGYHTFNELYDHRMALTAALMKTNRSISWRSKAHHPDGEPMFDGFFIVGMNLPTGSITYHYKLEHWHMFDQIVTFDNAPLWEGHTPGDVVDRLKRWSAEL